jgi:hypothetical protein
VEGPTKTRILEVPLNTLPEAARDRLRDAMRGEARVRDEKIVSLITIRNDPSEYE